MDNYSMLSANCRLWLANNHDMKNRYVSHFWRHHWWRHKDDRRAALAVKLWNNYISSSVSPSTNIEWMSNDKSHVIQLNCKQCLKFITRFEFNVYCVIFVFVPTRIDTWSSNVDTWSHLSRLLVCFLDIGIYPHSEPHNHAWATAGRGIAVLCG